MHILSRPGAGAALLGALALAQAQPAAPEPVEPSPPPAPAAARPDAAPPAPAQTIEITGRSGADDARRLSTASRIVVGREEIERFGDTNLSDVLRRLPGITSGGRPGRGGDVRMRGLGGGYTQLLIDGQRVPPGFSLDDLSPDQVERIEILRAPSAEFGARAIAGTVNIVLREALQRRPDELRASLTQERTRVQPNLGWTRNDTLGPPDAPAGAYTLGGSVFRFNRLDESDQHTTRTDLATGAVGLRQRETGLSSQDREGAQLNGRVQWRPDARRQWTGGFFLLGSRGTSEGARTLVQDAGSPPWAAARASSDNRYATLRLNAQWNGQLDEATRAEWRASLGGYRSDGATVRVERDAAGAVLRTLLDDTAVQETTGTLGGKLTHLWRDRHSLVAGWELERVQRRDERGQLQDGAPLLGDFGDRLSARADRAAVYVQDEWNPSPQWSAYAGLRWEGIRTRGSAGEAGDAPAHASRVLTPLLHAVWKPDPRSRSQLRMSLTQSYRSPPLGSLVGRPSISTRYPAPGGNVATSPDRIGNPALRPERANGIDLAWEHYAPGGGVASVSLFRREVRDLIRDVLVLQPVAWAGVERWVAQPRNVGRATTQGIELELKGRAADWLPLGPEAPRVQLNANLALFDSQVDAVPGPDDRLAEQPRATLNLGGDWRPRGAPLTLGGNLNLVASTRVRLSESETLRTGTRRSAEAFALWTPRRSFQLRLAVAEALPLAYRTASSVDADGVRETAESVTTARRQLTLRAEWKL